MVFGDDLEQQPAPFQQTNMGPIAPEFMQKIDHTDEVHELLAHARVEICRFLLHCSHGCCACLAGMLDGKRITAD
jgi:hypothetical protein